MKIEFTTRWNSQGYEFKGNLLKPIPYKVENKTTAYMKKSGSKHTKTEYAYTEMPLPHDIYKEFIKILEPFWDEGVKPTEMVEVINKDSSKYSEEVTNNFKEAIIKFADEYGAGDHGYKRPFDCRPMTTTAFLLDALQLLDFINTAEAGKMDSELEEIINHNKANITHALGDWRLDVTTINACIFYSFAMREEQYKIDHCRWCSAPVLHRKDAEFCQLPRQCKNKYHNELRKLKKRGSK